MPDDNRRVHETEFREAMPATAEFFAAGEQTEATAEDQGKLIAIVTLVLVALVVVVLGLLFLRGLDIIRSTVPQQQPQLPQSDSSGTLEL